MSKIHHFLLLPFRTPLSIKVDDLPVPDDVTSDEDGITPVNDEHVMAPVDDEDGMSPVKKVESYSGYTLNEQPRVIHLEDKKLSVVEIKDRWFGPDHTYFKVLADDGRNYLLRYDRESDRWAIEILPAET